MKLKYVTLKLKHPWYVWLMPWKKPWKLAKEITIPQIECTSLCNYKPMKGGKK